MSRRALRFPPTQPHHPTAPSNTEWKRYLYRLKSWFSGELLRALAEVIARDPALGGIALAYPLPAMTANYTNAPHSATVTDQMGLLIHYLDTEERLFAPLRQTVLLLDSERPVVVAALWRKHVLLQTIPEIARIERCSERTIQYLLAVGNGKIFTAYCHYTGVDSRLRKLSRQTEAFLLRLEVLAAKLEGDSFATLEEMALAGSENPEMA